MVDMKQQISTSRIRFERELRQAEYEIEKALEDAIINLKKSGMTRTSFYNMQVRQGKEMLRLNLPGNTVKSANEHLMKCMRIWDTEDLK